MATSRRSSTKSPSNPAWDKTVKGRVVYKRKTHLFKVKDIARIQRAVIRDEDPKTIWKTLYDFFLNELAKIILELFIKRIVDVTLAELKFALDFVVNWIVSGRITDILNAIKNADVLPILQAKIERLEDALKNKD